MTVEEYVMVATAGTVLAISERKELLIGHRNAYKATICPIPSIVCKDGTRISVQVHAGCHSLFAGIESGPFDWYSKDIGSKILMAETNSEDLNQYGIDTIEDIENYVDKHGGIDYEATMSSFIGIIHKNEKEFDRWM